MDTFKHLVTTDPLGQMQLSYHKLFYNIEYA